MRRVNRLSRRGGAPDLPAEPTIVSDTAPQAAGSFRIGEACYVTCSLIKIESRSANRSPRGDPCRSRVEAICTIFEVGRKQGAPWEGRPNPVADVARREATPRPRHILAHEGFDGVLAQVLRPAVELVVRRCAQGLSAANRQT